jgi:hypothetical protein
VKKAARRTERPKPMSAFTLIATEERIHRQVGFVPEAVIPSLVNASVMSDKTRHFFTVKIGEKDVSRRIGELCVHFISRPADM